MNILYIGPYRQKTIIGMTSLVFLKNILANNKSHNITSRPIYINSSHNLNTLDDQILNSEKLRLDHYDMVIQNVGIKDCIKIHSVCKNVIVPIINESVLSTEEIDRLVEFDEILTDSKVSYNRIVNSSSKLKNKTKTYDYDILLNSIPNNQFNIGILNKTKKIYFIGNYTNNITNVENLCRSFIKNISYNEYSLILYLLDMTEKLKNELNNSIQQIYSDYQIKYAINRTVIIPIESITDNIFIAHQTGDVFVNLQDDNTNSLNSKLALALKKSVVSFDINDYQTKLIQNNKLYKNCIAVSENAVDIKLKRVLSSNNYTENLVSFKKEHINKII